MLYNIKREKIYKIATLEFRYKYSVTLSCVTLTTWWLHTDKVKAYSIIITIIIIIIVMSIIVTEQHWCL